VNKVINHKSVVSAMRKTGNAETHEALNLWLEDVAIGEIAPQGGLDNVASFVRRNFSLSKIGFSVWTAMLNVTGVFQTQAVVGTKWLVSGLNVYRKNPVAAFRQAKQFSSFMSTRYDLDAWHKEAMMIREERPTRSTSDKTGMQQFFGVVQKIQLPKQAAIYAWSMMKATAMVIDTITWHAAYNKGVDKNMGHYEAVQYADSVLDNTQTSGLFSDRAGFERGTIGKYTRQAETVKMLTSLGSYMMAKGNIAAESIGRAKGIKGAFESSFELALLFVPEVLIIGLLKSQFPDDDEDLSFLGWLLGKSSEQVLGTMPVVREIPAGIKGFGGGGPLSTASIDMGKMLNQAYQGEIDAPLLKSIMNVVGMMTGLPAAQINRIIDYIDEGESPTEIITGKPQ
jgi:hypothetical protein